jgi:hypothetical protein
VPKQPGIVFYVLLHENCVKAKSQNIQFKSQIKKIKKIPVSDLIKLKKNDVNVQWGNTNYKNKTRAII